MTIITVIVTKETVKKSCIQMICLPAYSENNLVLSYYLIYWFMNI